MKKENEAGWILEANNTVTDYAPLTVANGEIGLTPSRYGLTTGSIILNGVYDTYGPDGVPRILRGLHIVDLDIGIEEASSLQDMDITDWHQQFDMRTACLTTTFTLEDRLQVEHRIVALRHLPNVALATLKVHALKETTVTLRHAVGVPEDFEPRAQYCREYDEVPESPVLSCEAASPSGQHRLGAAATYLFDYEGETPEWAHESGSEHPQTVRWTLTLETNEEIAMSVIGALTSTAAVSDPLHEAERLSIFAMFEGTERLMARHAEAWAELWESDIVIEGDLKAQQDVRFALYNLYAYVRAGSRRSIPPMGLSSQGYNGHIFWDAELWMVPPLLVLQPELARSCLDYRIDRLPAARRKAQAHGFEGSMYPWESAGTGEECTPVWALTGTSEHHITACVGIALWNYYRVTGDRVWLRTQGYPALTEIADFWVSRTEKSPSGDREIKNVVGADEYTGVVDNNAFTNGAAITALRYATQAARALGLTPDPTWPSVADRIPILAFEDGTTREYEGYEGETVKQADANLLSYPLELVTDDAQIRQDMDYYEPRFDEDAPAMTHSVLAVISARLGDRKRAAAFFKRAYQPNQRAPFGALTETPFSGNPYFATAAGGMLQAVLFGFGGLAFTDEGIIQRNPCLPRGWEALTLKGVGPDRETFTVKSLDAVAP